MKTTLHGINNRLDTAEGKISEPEDTALETTQNEHREKKGSVKMERVSVSCELWANRGKPNTSTSGVLKERRDTRRIRRNNGQSFPKLNEN